MALAAWLGLAGCIQLTGQRISLRYDQPRDRLLALIHYDGIHDNGSGSRSSAEKSLREFVRGRDAMFFDWFLHVQRERLAADAESARTAPQLRAFLRQLLATAQVTTLGHYRDAHGRIGAAQLVVIERASQLVAAANAAIDEAVLELDPAVGKGRFDVMLARWRAAAARGHAWVAIDGHALEFRFPIESFGWARLKEAFFAYLGVGTAAEQAAEPPNDSAADARLLRRFIASAPLSLQQGADQAAIRIGDRAQPSTMRMQWRDDYQPNVEHVVVEVAPAELDAAVAAALLDGAAVAEPVRELLAFGPPEERVRAVVAAARSGDGARRARALQWLRAFGQDWTNELRAPPAPPTGDDPPVYLAGWEHWYRTLLAEPQPR